MYIGIDIGGSNIRVASFQDVVNPKVLDKISFKVERNFEHAIDKIVEAIKILSHGNEIEGVGIALPGDINRDEGYIISSSNLPEWNEKPLKKSLQDHLNVLVKCEHDVSSAALGEALYGSGKNKGKFAFIIWGTGFGGAVVEVRDQKIMTTAIEVGHQIYDWNGPQCACGQYGCFELYIGGGSLKKIHNIDPAKITDEKVWSDLSQKAGHALINMTMAQPVDLIVYGGGIISKQPHLIEKIATVFKQKQNISAQPKHVLSALGEDAGLFGAIGLFRSEMSSV